MPIEVKEHVVETEEGERRVVIAQPTQPLVVNLTRLLALRTNLKESNIDIALQKAVCGREHKVHIFALRTESNTGERLWRFASDLAPIEGVELGYLMLMSQLNTYRIFAREGLYGKLITGLGKREFNAFNLGRERVFDQLEKKLESETLSEVEQKQSELDLWLLRNFVHFLPFETETALENFLPRCLKLLPGRSGVPAHLRETLQSA